MLNLRQIALKAIAVLGVSILSILLIAPAAHAGDDPSQPSSTSVSKPVKTDDPTPVVSPTSKPVKTDDPTPVVSPTPVLTKPVKTPVPDKKVFVCKYVGTPIVNERLQSGMNPISVAISAIQHNQWDGTLPGYFSDAQNRSYVLAYDTGQSESGLKCPKAVGPPAAVKQEVGLYIYPLLDITKAPSWNNSGIQDFCSSKIGTSWITTLGCTLPAKVCGPGWAYQQDKVENWQYDGAFKWPSHIKYPMDNIGWPPIYAAKHGLLSELINVPDCTPPPPVVAAPTATFEQVCTVAGPKITSLLTAGSSDATFQFFAGVIAIGSVDVKAGQTYPYVLTLASAYVDSSTTFEIKSGGVSLTGVQKVLSDCNPAVAIHPTSPTAADTCNTPPNVPGTSFEYGSEPVTNNETGAVTTTTAFEVKEGIYFLGDTALNGVHSYKVTFEANNGYVVAEPDRSIGDTYITNDSDGGIKVAIWKFPARECPVVTPPVTTPPVTTPPVTTPPVTPPVTTPPVTTPPVTTPPVTPPVTTPPVTTPPVTTPPVTPPTPSVTTVTKSGSLPSAATDLVTPDHRASLMGGLLFLGCLLLLDVACGAYLLFRQPRRRNSKA